MPTVINRHHYRGGKLPQPWMYIGRPTPLGNPFRHPEHPDALERYRVWLWERIREQDDGVMRMLAEIRAETHLVCSCAPRPCHGDVVVRAWEWLQLQKELQKERQGYVADPYARVAIGHS